MRKVFASSLVLAMLAACSSTSGVKGELVFGTIAGADWSKYCAWHNGELGSLAGKSCGGGTLLPDPQINCMAANKVPSCTATVSQVEDCVHKFKDHACDGIAKVVATCTNFPPSCNGILVGSSGIN